MCYKDARKCVFYFDFPSRQEKCNRSRYFKALSLLLSRWISPTNIISLRSIFPQHSNRSRIGFCNPINEWLLVVRGSDNANYANTLYEQKPRNNECTAKLHVHPVAFTSGNAYRVGRRGCPNYLPPGETPSCPHVNTFITTELLHKIFPQDSCSV